MRVCWMGRTLSLALTASSLGCSFEAGPSGRKMPSEPYVNLQNNRIIFWRSINTARAALLLQTRCPDSSQTVLPSARGSAMMETE